MLEYFRLSVHPARMENPNLKRKNLELSLSLSLCLSPDLCRLLNFFSSTSFPFRLSSIYFIFVVASLFQVHQRIIFVDLFLCCLKPLLLFLLFLVHVFLYKLLELQICNFMFDAVC